MLYVYAILGSEPGAQNGGPELRSLRIQEFGGVFAAVEHVNAAPAADENGIRAHDRIVRSLAAKVEAILPARFGSVVAGEQELAELLRLRQRELRDALELVNGREQMTLRIYGALSTVQQATARGCEELNSPGPGTRYLTAKMEHTPKERIMGLESIMSRVRPFLHGERWQHHATPPLLASAYHLIDRGQSAAYVAALHDSNDDTGEARITASGPWPPYAFAQWERR